jgi:hypothetical protein
MIAMPRRSILVSASLMARAILGFLRLENPWTPSVLAFPLYPARRHASVALAEVATEGDAREFRGTVTRNGPRFIRAEPVVGELRRRPQPNRSWPATSQNVTKYCRPEVGPQCGRVVPITRERRYFIITEGAPAHVA